MKEVFEIAIIGAGPAGIAMAVEARYADIRAEDILILEKGPEHSWAIRVHYPPDKLVTENYKGYDVMPEGALGIGTITKDDTLYYLRLAIAEHGLVIRYGEAVTAILRADDHFIIRASSAEYRARKCVIAVGILEKPNRPDYNLPRSLRPRIHFELGDRTPEGSDFLVVGGGDTAFERTLCLCRAGKRVTLSYRRETFGRLEPESIEMLHALECEGKLEILLGSNISKVEIAKSRPAVTFAEEKFGVRTFDHIVYCLGGTTPIGFLRSAGVEFEGERPLVSDGYETSVPGLFLIGDLSAGLKGGSVNWAFNSSHAAMRKICDKYLLKQYRSTGT